MNKSGKTISSTIRTQNDYRHITDQIERLKRLQFSNMLNDKCRKDITDAIASLNKVKKYL